MAKSKQKSKTERGGCIARGNQLFVALKEIGELGDNGKAVLTYGYGQRIPAPIDQPLALCEWLVRQILPMCHYSSTEARDRDLKAFKDYVNSISGK